MEREIQNGCDTEKTARTLVSIAMYRRLVAGDKMRVRSDGMVDLAGAAR